MARLLTKNADPRRLPLDCTGLVCEVGDRVQAARGELTATVVKVRPLQPRSIVVCTDKPRRVFLTPAAGWRVLNRPEAV